MKDITIIMRRCCEYERPLKYNGESWVEAGREVEVDSYVDEEMYKVIVDGVEMLYNASWQEAKEYAETLMKRGDNE